MNFKHADLQRLNEKLDPAKGFSARGRLHWDTEAGRSDTVTRLVALLLRQTWTAGESQVRFSDIERNEIFKTEGAYAMADLIPAALKRLARVRQIKIDFDRDGVFVQPGSAWIETVCTSAANHPS